MILTLLLSVHGSHGLSEGLSSALNLLDGLSSTLDLGATLTGVSTPLLESGGVGLSHGLGEGIGGALDLGGEVGSALHHVAALTGVSAPGLSNGLGLGLALLSAALAGMSAPGLSNRLSNGSSNGLRNGLGLSGALGAALAGVAAPLLGGTARSSLDGGGGHEGKGDVEELHAEGLDWKRESLKKKELVKLEWGIFCELKIADEDRWMMIVKMEQTWRMRRALYLLLGEEDVLSSSVLVGLRLLGCCLDERRKRCYSNPD